MINSETTSQTHKNPEEYQGWTVDGRFAHELDDALWVEKISETRWTVRIFIARPEISDTAEIKRAFERSFTEYGGNGGNVQRLWHEATGNKYSLRLGEGTIPVWLIEVDVTAAAGKDEVFDFNLILNRIEAVKMSSCGRLTYADCDAILEDRRARPAKAQGKYFGEFWISTENLREQLKFFKALGGQLAKRRCRFNLPNPDSGAGNWELTEDGVWRELTDEECSAGYLIVREMMIAANQLAAEWCAEKNIEILYRSQRANIRSEELRDDVTRWAQSEGFPTIENMLETVSREKKEAEFWKEISRRIAPEKACYSSVNAGHFALGVEYYAHFTSPLRRFADYFNWTAVSDYFDGINGIKREGKKRNNITTLELLEKAICGTLRAAPGSSSRCSSSSNSKADFLETTGNHLTKREQVIKQAASQTRAIERTSEIGEILFYFSSEPKSKGRAAFLKRKFKKAGESMRDRVWKRIIDKTLASDNVKGYNDNLSGVSPAASVAGKSGLNAFPAVSPASEEAAVYRKFCFKTVQQEIEELIDADTFGIREGFVWLLRPLKEQIKSGLLTIKGDTELKYSADKTPDILQMDNLRSVTIFNWVCERWGRARSILEYGRQQNLLLLELNEVLIRCGLNEQKGKPQICVRMSIHLIRKGDTKSEKEDEPIIITGEGKGLSKAAAREAAARNLLAIICGAEVRNWDRLSDGEKKSPEIIEKEKMLTEKETAQNQIRQAKENVLAASGNFVGWLNELVQKEKFDSPIWKFSDSPGERGTRQFTAEISGEVVRELMQIKMTAEDTDGLDKLKSLTGNGMTKSAAKQDAVQKLWSIYAGLIEPDLESGKQKQSSLKNRDVIQIPVVVKENYVQAVLEWLHIFAPGETLEFKVTRQKVTDASDILSAEIVLDETITNDDLIDDSAPDEMWIAELTNIPPLEGIVFTATHRQVKRAKQMAAEKVYRTLCLCASPKED